MGLGVGGTSRNEGGGGQRGTKERGLACTLQGEALNRGLFFADPPPSLLGAVRRKISEIR